MRFDHGTMRPIQPAAAAVFDLAELDEARTAETIAEMMALALADSADPEIQAIAAAHPSPAALFEWVQAHVSFVDDASNPDFALGRLSRLHELLIRPAALVRATRPQGDCDEFSMLLASLLLAQGRRPAFVTVAANPLTADYSHVYVLLDGRALDASHGPYPGWAAAAGTETRFGGRVDWTGKRRTWSLMGGGCCGSRLHGLGSTFTDTLVQQIPGLVDTGREVLLRRGTPSGYYRAQGQGGTSVETRVASGLDAFSLSPIVGGNSFPWQWIGLAAAGVLLIRAAMPGRGRR